MQLTVGICTWNRAALLEKTLDRMCQLVVPEGVTWELLVVNNNCTDHTVDVLNSYSQKLPVRRLDEPQPGKSFALNSAIRSINSDIILWTDDDVLVDPQWMAHYVKAATENPEIEFFGGPIDPWFEDAPPEWLGETWNRLSIAYAVRQCDRDRPEIDHNLLPFGANFAIRTETQKRYTYNIRLGRVGAGQRRGEETELVERMLDDGVRGLWCPDASVEHFIPNSRLGERYIRRFYYGIGQTDAVLEESPGSVAAGSKRGPTHALAKAFFAEMRFQCTRRVCGPNRWVKDLTKCGYYWGRLAG